MDSNNFFDDPFSSGTTPVGGDLPDPFKMGGGQQTPPPGKRKKHGLHWIQALVVLLVTTAAAFLLTQVFNIRYSANPELQPYLVLFNGLFYALLAAAILITAFLIELGTSAMTPRFSRKLQLVVALVAILLCGLIGALGELTFVNGYVLPQIQPTPTPVVTDSPTPAPATPTPSPSPTPVPSAKAFIIALDKSGSMAGSRDRESVKALNNLLPMLPTDAQIGLIAFTHEIIGSVPLALNTAAQRQKIADVADIDVSGATDFPNVMDTALNMLRTAGVQGPTKLIFITDGAGDPVDRYVSSCNAISLEVSAVMIGDYIDDLELLVNQTGGTFTSVSNLSDLLTAIEDIALATPPPTPTPSPSPTPVPTDSPTPVPQIGNMTYEVHASAFYLIVILALFGLVIGVALTLMLSLANQFRIQLILSPLMGVCAYLLIYYQVVSPDVIWPAYALFGLVLMRRNDGYGQQPNPRRQPPTGGGMPPINTPDPNGTPPFGGGNDIFGNNDIFGGGNSSGGTNNLFG